MDEQIRAELKDRLLADRDRLLESLNGAEEAAKPVQLDQARSLRGRSGRACNGALAIDAAYRRACIE